ncbi:P-loop containing nucleoside triphosphate hydrolase protein [Apodospora peruviana]|uniref:P-loop containing nucleoside triphosphate hydrolase protein n=1 Tax=Apodospora peruviana TaxID=516989 RepID=A0AAE0HYT2_9PEZI|nr:P-loop containing nucleoside triphosphate hydrolase protein [Apodospora peruviana]
MELETDAPMILVMGTTGSGKSRFVNYLMPGSAVEGSNLRSETEECQIVPVQMGQELVYVVDTPGFDDTYRTDAEILDDITQFLAAQYESGIKLRGIIFLHRITDVRMQGSALTHFNIFQELCGEEAFGNVILLTTMWDQLEHVGVGMRRQQELREEYWSSMVEHGSHVRKFHPASASLAEGLVCRLLEKDNIVLQVQKDVMEQGKALEATAVGRFVVERLEKRLDGLTKDMEKLEADAELARRRGDERKRREMEKKLEKLRTKRQSVMASRVRLTSSMQAEIRDKVRKERSASRWKDGIHIFASIVGLTLSATTNIILPLLGVAI